MNAYFRQPHGQPCRPGDGDRSARPARPSDDPSAQQHWERVYATRPARAVSWFQEHATLSLQLIEGARINGAAITPSDPILDVGGGASPLVRDLWQAGFRNLSLLDLSPTALEVARGHLGPDADHVRWIAANVLRAELPRHHDAVWHDRAVFHFLTDPANRHRYVEQVLHAVRPGGQEQAFVYCFCRRQGSSG